MLFGPRWAARTDRELHLSGTRRHCWRMRFDLSYPGLKLIIEMATVASMPEKQCQWRRDPSRREELDREGWRLIVVTRMIFVTCAGGVCSTEYARPSSTVVRLASAAGSRLNGYATSLPVPDRFSLVWCGKRPLQPRLCLMVSAGLVGKRPLRGVRATAGAQIRPREIGQSRRR